MKKFINFIGRHPVPTFIILGIIVSCCNANAQSRRVVKPAGFEDGAAMYAVAKQVVAVPQTITFTQEPALLPSATRKAIPICLNPTILVPVDGCAIVATPVHPVHPGDIPGRQPAL